ncbi:MAG: isomerase [Planctomycetes bacterium]|nr:isomerase [Planctomycetota bacterium]
MKLRLIQVDAFADRALVGNPAAVVPLEAWLPDALLLAIAIENNLSETAFLVPEGEGWRLRWFTPGGEVDLCGHATLATAHALLTEWGVDREELQFHTRSGALSVRRVDDGYQMDFPAQAPRPVPEELRAAAAEVTAGLGAVPELLLVSEDWIAIYPNEAAVAALRPDGGRLAEVGLRGVLASAPGERHDFVSRCFFPALGIPEDPVTGSAHCQLAPYWADRLGRSRLRARQISARGGELGCEHAGERVLLTGRAVTYLRGEIELP